MIKSIIWMFFLGVAVLPSSLGAQVLVVGEGLGGTPQVNTYSGGSFASSGNFLAYSPSFSGGVRVAFGDNQIVTGPGPGGPPTVTVFNGMTLTPRANFDAFSPSFTGGIFSRDGRWEYQLLGNGARRGPHGQGI